MQQEQTEGGASQDPAEFHVVDTSDMTIAQWERVKEQCGAAGYQYAAGLVVFRRVVTAPPPLSVVPPT